MSAQTYYVPSHKPIAEIPTPFSPSPLNHGTATYYVKNTTNKTMTAQAVPSVAPSNAAAHLKKLECFCFEQQELAPGEDALLPVRLLVSDELPKNIKNIILSYTIFDVTEYDDEAVAQVDSEGHHGMEH